MSTALLDRALRIAAGRGPGRTRRPARLAEAAAAAAVAPVTYASRPGTARAVLRRTCGSCPSGSRCCGSYTAFCCTLPGGSNFGCPPNTFVGGWWQCNYGNRGLCSTTNRRYYLDCSADPGTHCRGGCHCGDNECGNFKTCCVVFRYGQCNTQIPFVTPIMCRIITCVIPCQIDCLNCNCSGAVDQFTCTHEAGCL